MKYRHFISIITTAFIISITACKKPNFDVAPAPGTTGTVVDYLRNNFDFSLFYAALQKSGLVDSLNNLNAAYTVWAPLNSALNKEGIYTGSNFDSWPADSLRFFVRSHIQPIKLFYSDIPTASDNKYRNLNGIDLYISKNATAGGQFYLIVDGVPVQAVGALSTSTTYQYGAAQLNGVVYPLINALKTSNKTVQDFLSSQPDLTHLVTGLKKFGVWDKLTGDGPFTIVAPKDSAFERYGLTIDSINKLDPSKYDVGLFAGYCMTPNHFFLLDIQQLNGFNLVAFHTMSDSLDLAVSVSASAITLMSGCLRKRSSTPTNPGYIGPGRSVNIGVVLGDRFLGEATGPNVYNMNVNTPPYGKYINYTCTNGIVHLLSTVLALPSDVTK